MGYLEMFVARYWKWKGVVERAAHIDGSLELGSSQVLTCCVTWAK